MMDLFEIDNNIPENQLHTKYKLIKDDPMGSGERIILQHWVDGMVDRDNKMLYEFKTTFHSCFWEFYLYACFMETGFALNQTYNRPDFIIETPTQFYVESVVANIKDKGRLESDRNMFDLMDMFIPPKNQIDFYDVLNEAIVRDSNAITSKYKKYQKEYSKCEWVDTDKPYIIAIASYSQVNYGREYIYPMMALLYGMYYNSKAEKYERRDYIYKPGTNAQIPIGLFNFEEYSNISAILYSSSTTLGKLTSLAISAGYPSNNSVYNIRRDYEDFRIPYKLQKVSEKFPELLSDGLFLFHNPYAKNKLDIECFENSNVTQFFWKEGKLIHTSNTYPIVSRLNIPKILEIPYRVLIDEYLRQYNGYSPMEAYSLEQTEKIKVDFRISCLICIWFVMKDSGALRNIHYIRPVNTEEKLLLQEAYKETGKYEGIDHIERIDIIRTQDEFEAINQ